MVFVSLNAQIVIDNNPPYDNPAWLIDNILLGGGVIASNHSFQGEPSQVGWFNAVNTNLGIDSGIVMSSGDIYTLDPIIGGSFPILPNTVTDPDLLAVANSVPGMIGQSFSVSSINDVAILEFDFIPTSDSLNFRYAFGSAEYFAWENSSYNDVFGFFLSGPGIIGPYSAPVGFPNGSINLAFVPNTTPPLPITISSINSVTPINQQYFIDNQNGLSIIADADGFTTVLTARASVQCGATYHIRLAIADGSDVALNSYVWLEAGSFSSPLLDIVDNLGIDSLIMNIPCNSSITLTASGGLGAIYQWFDSTSTVISSDSTITVGQGVYVVSADILGCAIFSDTLRVIEGASPSFNFGPDLTIACNSDTLVGPLVSGGTFPYSYFWNSTSVDSALNLVEGIYQLTVTDAFGCFSNDDIEIFYDAPPLVNLGSDLTIACNSDTLINPLVSGGTSPYSYFWSTGESGSTANLVEGIYQLTVNDAFGCSSSDDIEIFYDVTPQVTISGGGIICDDETTTISFDFVGLLPWDLTYTNGTASILKNDIPTSTYTISTSIAGLYGIELADDVNDCIADTFGGIVEVIVNPLPIAVITPAEVTIYVGDEVELTAGNYAYYEWYTENDSLISIEEVLTVEDSGKFYIWVEDINGCVDVSDLATVNTVPLTQLFVPSIFTPNDDEHNELFVIHGTHIVTFNIKLYDRWGEQLFESNSIDKYWDGIFESNKVPQGSYYYQIEVLGEDGKMFKKGGVVEVIY